MNEKLNLQVFWENQNTDMQQALLFLAPFQRIINVGQNFVSIYFHLLKEANLVEFNTVDYFIEAVKFAEENGYVSLVFDSEHEDLLFYAIHPNFSNFLRSKWSSDNLKILYNVFVTYVDVCQSGINESIGNMRYKDIEYRRAELRLCEVEEYNNLAALHHSIKVQSFLWTYEYLCDFWEDSSRYEDIVFISERIIKLTKNYGASEEYESYMSLVYYCLGKAYQQLKEHEKAKKCIHEFVKYNKANDNLREVAGGYRDLASVEMDLKNIEQALEYANLSLSIFEQLDDIEEQIATHHNLGVLYSEHHNLELARPHYEIALKYYQEENDLLLSSKILLNLGIMDFMLEDYEESLTHLEKATGIAEDYEDERLLADIYLHRGMTYSVIGNFIKAKDFFRKALSIYVELNENHSVGLVLLELGNSSADEQEHALSKDYYLNALRTFEKSNNDYWQGQIYFSLGIGAEESADTMEVIISYYERALKKYNEVAAWKDCINVHQNLFKVYYVQQNVKDAEKQLEGITDLLEPWMGDISALKARVDNRRGLLSSVMEKDEEAYKCFENSLDFLSNNASYERAGIYNNMAIAMAYLQKYNEAMSLFWQGLEMFIDIEEIENEFFTIFNNINRTAIIINDNSMLKKLKRIIKKSNYLSYKRISSQAKKYGDQFVYYDI